MKIMAVVVVLLFLSSSLMVVGEKRDDRPLAMTRSFSFQEPVVVDQGSDVTVTMGGASACFCQAGEPILPMCTTTLQLPFGTRILDVTVERGEPLTMPLEKKITPAPSPTHIDITQNTASTDDAVYGSTEFYPAAWLRYTTGCGLNTHDQHVMFLTLQLFPTRYSPGTDTLTYIRNCTVVITYEQPIDSPFSSKIIYDLVIITPTQFVRPLQRLAAHKNSLGVKTNIVTLNAIYEIYPGVDKPEQIKYFVKDAVESWGTTYVLLVGGLKSHVLGQPRDGINTGVNDWQLPVRYSNLWDSGDEFDPGFISDLYYADLYDGTGGFCNWDSCGDGVFGGWSDFTNPTPLDYPTDQIDFYPDVCLGRLPCRNIFEVNTVVDKIIEYETTTDSPWFPRVVTVGGDPYDDVGTDILEGEVICDKVVSYLPGFEPIRLFASNQLIDPTLTPLHKNIVREINAGCGFLFFDGHGGPAQWSTFWPGEFDRLIIGGGLSVFSDWGIRNKGEYPVCVIGGCHCCQFNVSLLSTLLDPQNQHSMWTYGLPVPECLGWGLVQKRNAGAIATIGSTGIGYEASGENGDLDGNGVNDPDCVEALGGYLESQFFEAYGCEHVTVLGNAWCAAIAQYLSVYPGMQNRSDAKTIEQWVLLGDPSLRIG